MSVVWVQHVEPFWSLCEYTLPAVLNHAEQQKQGTELQLFVIARD